VGRSVSSFFGVDLIAMLNRYFDGNPAQRTGWLERDHQAPGSNDNRRLSRISILVSGTRRGCGNGDERCEHHAARYRIDL
jgi:hypothetical protein